MERFKLAVLNGSPVNPPIWWIAPEDKIAQTIDDEFLLGEKILAAPVVQQGEIEITRKKVKRLEKLISRKNIS
jgi:alpha-glucosidase (family GH31 glycosyl hydrolase)